MKIADTSSQDERLTPQKTNTKRWLAAAVSLFVVMLLWQIVPAARSWSQSDMSVSLSRVRLNTVKTADFTRDISAQGQVVAAVSPKLYAPADGTISLLLDAGTEVKQGEVLAVIRDLASGGMTMVMATHQMDFARALATEIVFMEHGKLIEQGSPADLLAEGSNTRTRDFCQRLLEMGA